MCLIVPRVITQEKKTFLQTYSQSVGTLLATAISSLTLEQQLELLERLLTFFVNQGVLDASVLEKCGSSALTEGARTILSS